MSIFKKSARITFRWLEIHTGSKQEWIKKLMAEESHDYADPEKLPKTLAIIWARKKPADVPASQLSAMEDARRKKRENDDAEKLAEGEYMLSSAVIEAITVQMQKQDRIGERGKSELGLTDSQARGVQRMIDDSRSEVAKELKCPPAPQP